ncbi:hypothetical protein VTO73DRAFT_11046 [Trametes versicolor]
MDSLPVETLQQIFEHACTDGGFTGNALSLTSKQIRAAVRRARFHTLRVSADGKNFPDFVAFFERECNSGGSERPRVRHLYLTLASVPYIPPWVTQTLLTLRNEPQPCPTGQEAGQSPNHSTLVPPPTLSRERAVQELVRLVAPDLWSLVLHAVPHASQDDLQYPILEHTFPLLREVAFIGLPGPTHFLRPDAKPWPASVFPRATHLHLSPSPRRAGGHDLHLSSWSALAPRVTHLRLSRIENRHHVQQLAEAIGVHVQLSIMLLGTAVLTPPAAPLPRPELPRTYPSVRCLLMEPAEMPRGRKCGNFALGQAVVGTGLGDIVRECQRPEVDVEAVLFKRPDTVPYVQHAKILEEQWVERVEGREGWWKGLE